MKNNKIILVILVLAILVAVYFLASWKKSSISDLGIVYTNSNYGFTFSLPDNWQGYSIVVENNWQGNPLNTSTVNESGPKLLIRNPKWTSDIHYEDIPIMVFTLKQWSSYMAGDFAVSAAPIPATELAQNNFYIFALPPRWDFDYSQGYEEAQNILENHPLKVFDIEKVSILQDVRQCYSYNREGTNDEPYTVNEFLDITISGAKVTGTKSGTQNGPDMTNGYSGTIEGTLFEDTITDVFSYVVEGSHNKESEIYRARADKIGIEKLRYPLIEKNGILVPDITKEFKTLLYARVSCTASN